MSGETVGDWRYFESLGGGTYKQNLVTGETLKIEDAQDECGFPLKIAISGDALALSLDDMQKAPQATIEAEPGPAYTVSRSLSNEPFDPNRPMFWISPEAIRAFSLERDLNTATVTLSPQSPYDIALYANPHWYDRHE